MNHAAFLQPDFDAMPLELCATARWVTWKGAKVPYCPTSVNSKASVIDPGTWGTFSQARAAYEEGGYLGVGFVLSAAVDGIVGVDLDKCVHTNEPDPAALALLDRIGCQYIELSPSGNGLRGFGYGEPITGTKGLIDGIKAELYASGRYLTVTGHTIKQGPLVPLLGFLEVASAIRGEDLQKRQKKQKQSSVSSVSSVNDIPASAVPTMAGMRNRCLFALARHLKFTQPDMTRSEQKAVVTWWHETYLDVIDTKDFSVTWMDFLHGWDRIKHLHGDKLRCALEQLDPTAELPEAVQALEYGGTGDQLVRICMALQSHYKSEPFFIGVRKAGELLGINHSDAAKMLSRLVSDGVLNLVSKGAGARASRYRFVGAT